MSEDANKGERLRRAIRAFTVDAVDHVGRPAPNGPAEAAFVQLSQRLLALPDPAGREIAALAARFCDADADRLRELRLAAEAFFGEGFKEPSA